MQSVMYCIYWLGINPVEMDVDTQEVVCNSKYFVHLYCGIIFFYHANVVCNSIHFFALIVSPSSQYLFFITKQTVCAKLSPRAQKPVCTSRFRYCCLRLCVCREYGSGSILESDIDGGLVAM